MLDIVSYVIVDAMSSVVSSVMLHRISYVLSNAKIIVMSNVIFGVIYSIAFFFSSIYIQSNMNTLVLIKLF
jgi:hypothetical protein